MSSTSSPQILVIILNYRTAEMTLRSAAAARQAMASLRGEILIVDNDSGDGSFEALQTGIEANGWADAPVPVSVIQSGHNGGFGAGNNVGFRAGLADGTRPDYYYILNSDAFPEPSAIQELLEYMEQTPGVGLAGSQILGEDGMELQSAFRFPSLYSEIEGGLKFGPVSRRLAEHIVAMPIPEETCEVDWAMGASLLIRAKVLDKIGGFDECFFLYFDETDLCLRAKRQGFTTGFVKESIVTHIGSVSTGMKAWKRVPDYWYESRRYYFGKNHGWLYAFAATLLHLLAGGLHWFRCVVTGKDRGEPRWYLLRMMKCELRALLRVPFVWFRHRARTESIPCGE